MKEFLRLFWNHLFTFIKPIVVHVPINVQILPHHKGELCFWMLIRSIVGIITKPKKMYLRFKSTRLENLRRHVMIKVHFNFTCNGQCRDGPVLCISVWTWELASLHYPSEEKRKSAGTWSYLIRSVDKSINALWQCLSLHNIPDIVLSLMYTVHGCMYSWVNCLMYEQNRKKWHFLN